jgi:leucyl-tRNA synthetase
LAWGRFQPCSMEPLECFRRRRLRHSLADRSMDCRRRGQAEITRILERARPGRKTINYKLRDWLFSRQRYWGEPFPSCGQGDVIARSRIRAARDAAEMDDFKPTGTPSRRSARRRIGSLPPIHHERGEGSRVILPAALAQHHRRRWRSQDPRSRETNTMPQWAGAAGTICAIATRRMPSASSVSSRALLDGRRQIRRRRPLRRRH